MVDNRPALDLVSIIIPAYNAEDYIGETLRSALLQTYHNIEIVVVDDGCTDGTVAVVDHFAALDERVRLIRQPNGGVARARNFGIAEAKGRFIAPLDADDLWHPEKIERQMTIMRQSPHVGCVCTWCCSVNMDGRIIRQPVTGVHWKGYVLPALVLENFSGCASSPLMCRHCVLEVGGYDTTLHDLGAQGCEDWKLLLAIAKSRDVVVVPLALTGYRQVPDSMSQRLWEMLRSYELVMADVRQTCPEIPNELYRWSRSRMCRWLASRAILQGAYLVAMRLCTILVSSDWAYGVELMIRGPMRFCWQVVRLLHNSQDKVSPSYPEGLSMANNPGLDWMAWMDWLINRHRRHVHLLLTKGKFVDKG